MKKKLKKYGKTLVLSFTKEEQEIYKLKEGSIIEVWLDDGSDSIEMKGGKGKK